MLHESAQSVKQSATAMLVHKQERIFIWTVTIFNYLKNICTVPLKPDQMIKCPTKYNISDTKRFTFAPSDKNN